MKTGKPAAKKPTKARNTSTRGKKKTKEPQDDWDDISTGD